MPRGRKPVHLTAAGKPSGRQAIWEAMRRLVLFTLPQLEAAARVHRDTVRTYLVGLERAGYIARTGEQTPASGIFGVAAKTQFRSIVFRLINDVGVQAPRVTRDGKPVTQGASREQMWRTMRMLGGDFSALDLATAASTEAHPVSEVDAADYAKHLAKAGYLLVVVTKPARYRFVKARYTGPKPPMVQRMKTVFDPNLGRIVWHDEVDA